MIDNFKFQIPPKISVLIPVYNGQAFIDETIQSVFKQTFQDFELIISDNASTDDTPRIIEKYLIDPRVRYYRQSSNIGMAGNFNTCMLLSQGKYLKFLCADDKLHENALTLMNEILDAYPEVTLVTSYRQQFGDICKELIAPEFGIVTKERTFAGILCG